MSKEREINTPGGLGRVLSISDLEKLSDAQLDAHVATVLDRGLTNVRLRVPLPDGLHGEWVPNDPQSVYEKQILGFTIDDKYATTHSLHSDGSGRAIIGDVIHMVAPQRLMDAIEKKRRLDYDARHAKKVSKEERDYLNEQHKGVGLITESNAEQINLDAITAANNAATKESQS